MEAQIRIAIIGGGPVGLATLKTFVENNTPEIPIEGRLFETKEGVGGSFFFRDYENGMLYSSKQLTAFSDFRMPTETPSHISFADYVIYLNKYCSHFNLWPHIKLRTHVVQVEPLTGERWQHRIHYNTTNADGSTISSVYDCSHIAVCTGLQAEPKIPYLPGIENFRGKVLHSSEYKGPSQFANEDVVILGCGESAMDIAQQIVNSAATVTMCFRHGFLSFPKVFYGFKVFGRTIKTKIPLDWLSTNLFQTAFVHDAVAKSRLQWLMSDAVVQWALWLLTGSGAGFNQYIGGLPVHKWRKVFVNRSEVVELLNRPYNIENRNFGLVGNPESRYDDSRHIDTCTFPSFISPTGAIKFTKDEKRIDYQRLIDKNIRATSIIFCTGYEVSPSFLPKPYPSHLDASCRIVSPNHPSIAFLGFSRAWVGAIGPMGEMEAMWLLAHVRGDMKRLPTSEPCYKLQSSKGNNVDFGVDYSTYMATLANDIGAKPKLFSVWREYGLKVLLTYCLGASFISVYRLTGPFKNQKVMKNVVEGELLQTVKAKGWIGNFFFGALPLLVFGLLNGLAWILDTVGLLGK